MFLEEILLTRLRASETEFTRPDGVVDGAVMSVFRVPPESAGQRLDVFLQGQLKRTSRTRTQFIIHHSAFSAQGQRLRSNHRVKSREHVLLWRPPWDEDPVPTRVPVLHEDEHLFAVDKPAGLPVHPTARYYNNTLINVLKRERPGAFLSLGHRIDRETSGVLLVSKSPDCDRTLKRKFEERTGIEKTYTAITWGVPDPAMGVAASGIVSRADDSPNAFRYERSIEIDPASRFKVKMRLGETTHALSASTRFVVEAVRTRCTDGQTYARIRCVLETGRQHQIRIHLASLGAPIVGDKLYGPDETCFARGVDGLLTKEDFAKLELSRHALHASRLTMTHPMTGEPLAVEAPLPEDLAAFWDAI
ncbi:MAG: RluA family pseudouridine synthase [Polyangiaceae bacterium]|nr:RluA family pseudouridine synthase [Polyangiaceae bacterium]